MSLPLYAGIELGGTKTICLVSSDTQTIVGELKIPTTSPEETLATVTEFLQQYGPIAGIGIGSFGPLNVDPDSVDYGTLETTPKSGWPGTNLYSFFSQRFDCPIAIDTDVNVAGLAEYHMGAAQNLRSAIYITVGTGIGAGAVLNGQPVFGLSHPEMGHLHMLRPESDKDFACTCPYHEHCVEGLASGVAVSARWGAPLNEFPLSHPAWDLQAEYLAQLSHALVVLYSPQRIIFGGGVSSEPLLVMVRDKLFEKLNGYVAKLQKRESLDSLITLPQLGGMAGPMGSLLLGQLKKD